MDFFVKWHSGLQNIYENLRAKVAHINPIHTSHQVRRETREELLIPVSSLSVRKGPDCHLHQHFNHNHYHYRVKFVTK